MMKRVGLAACLLAACASGRSQEATDADVGQPADAKVYLDGRIEPGPDGSVVHPADASVPVPVDAPKPIDAYVCQVHTQQLLANPALDLSPAGTGWVMQNIDNAYPVVTGDGVLGAHSAPYKAWMGGIEATTSSVTDALYQDVAIPAGTTSLVVTGYYDVRTAETTTTTVYDRGDVSLIKTDGTPLETVIQLTNLTPTTAWTSMSRTFSGNYSGQTVRLRFTTTNDILDATSFYFDTLALTATYCQ